MVKVVSFYMDNINLDVVHHQKKVIKTLYPELELEQVHTNMPHGMSMDKYIETTNAEVVVFLDIDAIPLNGSAIWKLVDMCQWGEGIAGAPQRANHINNDKHIYVAPSVMAVSPSLIEHLGYPSAMETSRSDVGEEWTYCAERYNVEISFLDVIRHDDGVAWDLRDGKTFGLNTYYGLDGEEMFFHAFQGRMVSQQASFINTCKKLLNT